MKRYLMLFLLVLMVSGCGEDTRTLASITVSPSTATVGINKTLQFFATCYDQNGKVLTVDVTWSASSAIGSITSSGKLYASSDTATGTVHATARGITGSASVTVTNKGWVKGRLTNSSGDAVPDILVFLAGHSALRDYSDSSGDYSISEVPAGDYEVKTGETVLYISSSAEVSVPTAESVTENFLLTDRISVTSENISPIPVTSITGTVYNNGSTEAKGVEILYTFNDSEGNPIGFASGNLGDIPGRTSRSFSIAPTSPITGYASFDRTVAAKSF